jgi:hypothetical protein
VGNDLHTKREVNQEKREKYFYFLKEVVKEEIK